ncbi:hypothetical protein HAX54_044011 [Datura stramonium]|uniref:Non-structural maintenance of chromosomes element 4 n=1 Tax=Datura stramonium TaxID=4076 RepID=A0ABS8W5C7_DATST|nr:hypothetical protein [Datura stramonium]
MFNNAIVYYPEENHQHTVALELRAIIVREMKGKDDTGGVDSRKFKDITKEIEISHNEVKKPREQVTDVEALLDLTRILVSSVRSRFADGVTPYMFISSLLGVFGERHAKGLSQNANTLR